MTDDLSYQNNICINCVHQLTITYSFKTLIESSHKTLMKEIDKPSSSPTSELDNYESDVEKPKPKVRFKRRAINFENRIQQPKVLYCVECKAQFTSLQSLTNHCKDNHPVKCAVGRDCTYCSEKFEDFRSLVLHRKLHLRPLLCEQCWDGFYTENELSAHTCRPSMYKEKDKSKKVLRQCDQCGKSYPPGYITIHMRTHSSERPYCCKFCPKKFKVLGGLHSHILWNHKRTRNHKCEVCNATFISSSSRSSHIRKNHLKEKKYGCESCGKRFFSKSELQRHSLTHTGVKNFHCHLCDKSYQTRYGLNVHLKSHSHMSMNVLNL